MYDQIDAEIERLFRGVRPRCNPIKFSVIVLLSALLGAMVTGFFCDADTRPANGVVSTTE